MQSFGKLVLVLCVAVTTFCSACSSDNQTSGTESPAAHPNQDSQNPPVSKDSPKEKISISFKKFGIIREFGVADNAALFGLLPNSGKFQITEVMGPDFLKKYGVGELNRTIVDKLFLKTAKPLSQSERDGLLSDFDGATIIYIEGYNGNLCNQNETEYEIKLTGEINDVDIEVRFKFAALPNANGNCAFHTFGIITRYVN